MKKLLSLLLCLVLIWGMTAAVSAADPSRLDDLKERFKDGCGPETNGLAVDYVYFEPAQKDDAKYPLVIYFHGAGQGRAPRSQIAENNFPLWASDELQSRFAGGGAYLLVPRSHEEKGEFWKDSYIPAVKAMIDDFIAQHSENIDLSRIYVGGFSMGGKMTLKMISSYPSMFAAAFPACPAYRASEEQLAAVADMPIWLIVSRFDVIAGYYSFSEDIWAKLCSNTNIPGDCRLSLFTTVKLPDGKKAASNHHVWFAVANDMFTYEEGPYPNMTTFDASGEELTLQSPDGLISWLCSYTSDYDGRELESTDLAQQNPDLGYVFGTNVFRTIFLIIKDAFATFFTEVIPSLFK